MHLPGRHYWLVIIGSILWLFGSRSTAVAQETPIPTLLTTTPAPTETPFVLPPGDTTILVAGAVLLVLIVLGAVIWTSSRYK